MFRRFLLTALLLVSCPALASSIIIDCYRIAPIGVIFSGQSNAQNLYDDGLTQYLTVFNAAFPSTSNTVLDGATSGSALINTNSGDTNWWYKPSDGTYGTAWDNFAAAVAAHPGTIVAIHWDQGESDLEVANSGAKRLEYKDGLVTLFGHMRALVGNVPVVISPIGRRGDTTVTNLGYQNIREIQKELDLAYDWIYLLPEKFTEGDDGGPHLDTAGYQNYATKAARKTMAVLGAAYTGVDGPTITSALRTGTSVVVTISHDSGSDFTPTTAIEGFKFFDGTTATEIAINSAVRTNATTITLTLASAPTSGAELLYYGWNPMNSVDETNLVLDNTAYFMPLRSYGQITDTLPAGLTFTDVTSAAVSTQYTADATVTAFDGTLTASVTSGTAEIRKNSTGAWGSSVDVISGDIINARMTSSGSVSTAVTSVISLGAASDSWSITTGAGAGSLADITADAVFDLDATKSGSYSGSGDTWANLVPSPSDGSAQTAYDFFKGLTSGAEASDLTFTGTAGNAAAYWLSDGGDVAKQQGSITAFLRDIHKTTGGSDFTIGVAFRFIQNDATQVLFATSSTSTVAGLRVVTNSSEKLQLIQRDDAGVNNSATSTAALVTNTDYLAIVSHSHSLGNTKLFINSLTAENKAVPFGTSTTNANSVAGILGESDAGVPAASGTRLYAVFATDNYITDAAAFFTEFESRHSRDYTP